MITRMKPTIHDLSDYPDKRLGLINEATDEGHLTVEAACAHRYLDDLDIPREEEEKRLSLVGRIMRSR